MGGPVRAKPISKSNGNWAVGAALHTPPGRTRAQDFETSRIHLRMQAFHGLGGLERRAGRHLISVGGWRGRFDTAAGPGIPGSPLDHDGCSLCARHRAGIPVTRFHHHLATISNHHPSSPPPPADCNGRHQNPSEAAATSASAAAPEAAMPSARPSISRARFRAPCHRHATVEHVLVKL